MKDQNGFLHDQKLNKQQRVILRSTFHTEVKNFPEIAIAEVHTATAYG